ncbi:MAG: STAS domain-containing protein [Spirochaetia bacterium]|nr:STAS domain-containing protein [Spirochaetia bacterium]
MEVLCYEKSGVAVIQMRGSLTHASVQQFEGAMKEALQTGTKNVVTDVEGITFVDSLGLGALIRSYMIVRKAGGNLKLACASAELNRALRQAGLASTFPGLQSVDAALNEFSNDLKEASR